MSVLVQILLPSCDNAGHPFPDSDFERLVHELTERFGGVTAFTRAPAEGRWKQGGGTEHDEIFVFEVMADDLDRRFWRSLRAELERRFRQDVVIIRAQGIELL
jgi:hypothetical protein